MWVQKLKSGKYSFRENWKDPLSNTWKQVSCTFGKNNNRTRKEAQLILDEKIRKKLAECGTANSDITFKDLSSKYLDLVKKQLAYHTWYCKSKVLQRIIKDWGADVIAKSITTQFINKYFDGLLYDTDNPLTNSTVKSYKINVQCVYEYGIKYGYVKKNPVKNSRLSLKDERKRRKIEIESKYLEDWEYKAIIADCNEHGRKDIADLLTWLYLTGMRCGEAASLQKKNIYQNKDGQWFARVNGTLIKVYGKKDPQEHFAKTASAKTVAGNRDVLLSPLAVKIAKEHIKNKKPNDRLFINEWKSSKGYFIPSVVDSLLKGVAERQHIKKLLMTHIFRHTHVSKLAELGVPLYVIQRRVGHTDGKVTRQIYLHVTKKAEAQLAGKLKYL